MNEVQAEHFRDIIAFIQGKTNQKDVFVQNFEETDDTITFDLQVIFTVHKEETTEAKQP
jgi:hypothetical protein